MTLTTLKAIPQTFPSQLLIGGRWCDGADQESIDVLDPATGDGWVRVASGTEHDAAQAVDAAHSALAGWAARAPRERAEVLRRAFELTLQRQDLLAETIVRENGKTLSDALGEVAYAAEFFRWYSEEAPRLLGTLTRAPSGANDILVEHHPVGVCVLVTPWNFPAAMATRKIAPALAAGCTVVLKPASATPVTALLIGQLLTDAGVPPGVVNVIPSQRSGAVVGAMLADERVRKLSFTGSTEVGRVLLAGAADGVVNCSMELGGNAPFIVFEDADLDEAIAGAMIAKMRNGGEACTAANRFLVAKNVVEAFTARLAQAMSACPMGSGLDPTTGLGPLVDAATRDKVAQLVDSAVAEGATLVTGGVLPEGSGFFYPPTVLADVAPGSRILGEEIFGPVAPITTFSTEDEAVALANDTEYGLVAYVYTTDTARGMRIARRLESGMVGLNRGLVSDPAAPFGGVKASGIGREGGHEGVLDYTESQYIALKWG